MKWVNGETWESKVKRLEDWHKWFAWYPVIVDFIEVEGKERTVKVWLDYVERKGQYDPCWQRWNWVYR